jgi:HD-like signal output (HDOD) protein
MIAASTNAVVTVDEELWFGNLGDDKELEDRAAQSMAAVAARVLGAKPFPAAARRLEELTRSQGTKIEQVVGVLESDPGLSMRLLRLVNSAGYALRVRCTSVRHAAALVGMRRLHQLATTAAVLDLFDTGGNPAIKSLLNHAAVVGAFCRYLAVHVDLAPDELFTCGFLHDIGKLMLIDAEGAPYLELVEKAGESPDLLHLLEQETYGFDHAVLGAHVLKNWRIPNPVPRVVAWHHNVARAYQADPAIAAMVQALRLADQLSYLVRTHPEPEGIAAAAQSPAAAYLGISEAQLSTMWGDLSRLSQRINAQPGGAEEIIPREDSIPPSMRPKGRKSRAPAASMPPSMSIPPETSGPISEVPKHFLCVVCKKASFGNRCPVCSGHVCANHQVGVEQWCTECASAYSLDVGNSAFPMWERLTAAGIVVGAGLLSLLVAVLAGRPIGGALFGSVLLSSLCVLVVLIGRRFWLKRSFLRTRAQVTGDETGLPLGLTMPPDPTISMMLSESASATAFRPTERINPAQQSAGLPALFSFAPGDSMPPRAAHSVPASVPAPASMPAPASIPAMVPAVLSPHAGTSRASMPTAPVPARDFTRGLSAVPTLVHAAPPPAAEPARPPVARPPSMRPDTGWRPVERTEPAMPLSRSGPTELRRLAESLPSIPPAAEPPAAAAIPTELPPPEAAATIDAPAAASTHTEPVAAPPPIEAAPPAEAAPSVAAPSVEFSAESSEMTPTSSPGVSVTSEHASEFAQAMMFAACNPVEPSLLVACRPVSMRPRHFACSPSTR